MRSTNLNSIQVTEKINVALALLEGRHILFLQMVDIVLDLLFLDWH
jgi:hypothetical protein